MASVEQAIAPIETPVFFEAGNETLFGIATEPATEAIGVAAIFLRGGNQGPSSGRNQTSTRLCRRLSREGFHAFRFDYRGVGESTGSIEQFHHAETFDEDLAGAVEWFRARGIERFVLIGSCFGARTALSCGPTLQGLEAMALLATPVRDKLKDGAGVRPVARHRTLWQYGLRAVTPSRIRLLSNRRGREAYARAVRDAWRAEPVKSARQTGDGPPWVSALFLSSLEANIKMGVHVLFLNGTGDPGFEDFEKARAGRFGHIIESAGPLAEVQELDGRVGAFADASLHEPVIELVATWMASRESGHHTTRPSTT